MSGNARSWAARLVSLYAGLVGFGVSIGLMVRARLGLAPWDVFHQAIAQRLGIRLGWVVIAVSALVLVLWIPLRQRPGLGTLSNAILVGVMVNVTLSVVPAAHQMALRVALLVGAILLNAVATAAYIGAGLGPGPRDGLMTGLAQRGHSVRLVRSGIEISVCLLGVLLGGPPGVGTLAYALAIGPLVHVLLPVLGRGPVGALTGGE